MFKTFTLGDIVSTAEISPRSAIAYLGALTRAGYLCAQRKPLHARRWMLLRDTGPRAPRVRRHSVLDLNSGEEISTRRAKERRVVTGAGV